MWEHLYFIDKQCQNECYYRSESPFVPPYESIVDILDTHYLVDHVIVQPQQKRIKIFVRKI